MSDPDILRQQCTCRLSHAFHVVVPLQEGVDVLVATPGRVATLLEAEALSLEDCRAIVLDEVCPPPPTLYNTLLVES